MKNFIQKGYIFLVLVFIYAPIFLLIIYSFTTAKTIGTWNGFSFDLYREVFTNKEILSVIGDTLLLALLASVLSTILGTLGAIGIFYQRRAFGKMVNGASKIPVINAEIVTAVSLALFLSWLFATSKSYFGLLIGHMIICTPFVVLSIMPKLKQMDKNLYEAALDLGATPFKALWKVVIPQILPGILSGFMLSVTLSLDDYYFTEMLKPNGFDTISTKVANALRTQKGPTLTAFRAVTTIIFIIILLVVIIMNVRANKKAKNSK